MADKDKTTKALQRAKWAHDKWVQADAKAEGFRAARNLAILDAADAGHAQVEIAEELGLTKQAVGSIIRRSSK